MSPFKVESLLSARLFLSPQLVGDRLYFISNLSGRMSLYAMDKDGSVPEPLLPPDIALQNPVLVHGMTLFKVFPSLNKILVLIDHDGDENYQPMVIPLTGGIPEPLLGDRFAGQQVHLSQADPERALAVLEVDPRTSPIMETFFVNLATLEIVSLGSSLYGNSCVAVDEPYTRFVLADGYTTGDVVLFTRSLTDSDRTLLYGLPLEARQPDQASPLTGFGSGAFTPGGGLLTTTVLFDDHYSLAYLPLDQPQTLQPVAVEGLVHTGEGEMEYLEHLEGDRYLLTYNIDGCSWAYEGHFDEATLTLHLNRVLCGVGALSQGVLQEIHYDRTSGAYALAFSTATSPVQLYRLDPDGALHQLTRERVLGIPAELLAPGEDASFISHDGLRVSARLYLPAPGLGFQGPRPVVFYIHGGPQGQERPDFTWFSMPLIQYLTLNGFAVFVPNARGSTGYGLAYTKRVDHDWGGQDRLDHVAALEHLRQDPRLDTSRAAVVGRSYGGYMTLTLIGRHPELWSAACDMFGPYNLFTFLERLPETWKTYFYLALGHPEKDHDFLVERSPSTHLSALACPLLVIQGRNDPRVKAAESEDVVNQLRAQGKQVEIIIFENEGHDVIKYENKVRCYSEITRFFVEHLRP